MSRRLSPLSYGPPFQSAVGRQLNNSPIHELAIHQLFNSSTRQFTNSANSPIGILWGSSLQKRARRSRGRRVRQLSERLGLDLANALAADGEALADFLERMFAAVADAEPHLD